MRCINMKIIDILLFSINLMAVKPFTTVPKEQTSQVVDNGTYNKFERECPDFWKVIQNSSVVEWTNCPEKVDADKKVTEEKVLQFACFFAKNMMMFICDNKLSLTNDNLRLLKSDPICPFTFSRLIDFGQLAEELTNAEHCDKVCYDLYDIRPQCVILAKLNNFLKSIEKQHNKDGLNMPDVKKSEINTPVYKAVKIVDTPIEQKRVTETTPKIKTEATSNKTSISSVKVQTDKGIRLEPEKLEIEKQEPETSRSEKPIDNFDNPENSGVTKNDLEISEEESKIFKAKNDDSINLKDNFENDGSVDNEALKNDMGLPETRGNPWEEENVKAQMPFNQKEINPNDEFLQAEDSHFFFYFVVVSSIIVIGYIGFHNKNKILAYALEGTSGRRNRRRPNPARYRKLETNLEEAISSNASETVASSIVY